MHFASSQVIVEVRVEANNTGRLWIVRCLITTSIATALQRSAHVCGDSQLVTPRSKSTLDRRDILASSQLEAIIVFKLAEIIALARKLPAVSVDYLDAINEVFGIDTYLCDLRKFELTGVFF